MLKKVFSFILIFVIIIQINSCCFATINPNIDESMFFSDSSATSNSYICISTFIHLFEFVTMLVIIPIIMIYSIFKMIKLNYRKKDKSEVDENKIKKEKRKITILLIIVCLLFVIIFLLQISFQYAKPIIYIYPEEETEVIVKIKNEDKLLHTYPKYESEGWKVMAEPDGILTDLKTGRKLYSLYWEGKNTYKPNYKEGFVVKGEDTAKFLEEKLEILGLNEKESEEFIIYWLPQMESNNYNYIRFENAEELNKEMPLEITPKPDTLIRINMEFKSLLFPINVKEQQLEKVERKGYTVVEWGGTKL